jgi:chromosome segregation ATPase
LKQVSAHRQQQLE